MLYMILHIIIYLSLTFYQRLYQFFISAKLQVFEDHNERE